MPLAKKTGEAPVQMAAEAGMRYMEIGTRELELYSGGIGYPGRKTFKRAKVQESEIEYLKQRINVLEKIIFAPSSEKRRPDEGEGGVQLHIFNEAEALEEKKQQAPLTVAEHTRSKPGRKPLPPICPG